MHIKSIGIIEFEEIAALGKKKGTKSIMCEIACKYVNVVHFLIKIKYDFIKCDFPISYYQRILNKHFIKIEDSKALIL